MTALADHLEAFLAGATGVSVRSLSLGDLSPEAAHKRLLAAGFVHERRPLAAERTMSGTPKARRLDGGATSRLDAPFLAAVDVYLHPDGGMVEILPAGDPSGRHAPSGLPSAIKSVRFEPDRPGSVANRAFRVTDDGRPIPRSRRSVFGMKQDPLDHVASRRFANTVARRGITVLAGAAIGASASGEPHFVGPGLTIVPADFWSAARVLAEHAALDPTIRIVEEGPDTAFLFGGAGANGGGVSEDGEGEDTENESEGLASLRILRGGCVFHVDPEGYEASVAHLGLAFCWVLDHLGPCRVIDDETGIDRSFEAMRLPSSVLGAAADDASDAEEGGEPANDGAPLTVREIAKAS